LTFRELIDQCYINLQKGHWLIRMEELANILPHEESLMAERVALGADVEALRRRIRVALNQAYTQLARTFFPIHGQETVKLDAQSYVRQSRMVGRVMRYRAVSHEGRAQVFMQHGTDAEVFAPPESTVLVRYDVFPESLTADSDVPRLPPFAPPDLLTFMATSAVFAQDSQRASAAFWDAKYKDLLAQVLKNRNVRLPGRVWR